MQDDTIHSLSHAEALRIAARYDSSIPAEPLPEMPDEIRPTGSSRWGLSDRERAALRVLRSEMGAAEPPERAASSPRPAGRRSWRDLFRSSPS